MNLIILSNIVSFLFFGLAGLVIVAKQRDAQLPLNVAIPLGLSLFLYAFITFSNVLEHSDVSSYFDVYEDVAEVVFLFVCILFANNWRTQRNMEVLRKNQTKLSEALASVSEKEKQYRHLMESANDAIFVAQEGKIQFYNSRTHDLLGCSSDDIYAANFADFIHPEDHAIALAHHEDSAEKDGNLPSTYQCRIITKDGKELTVQINSVFVEWNKLPATLNFVRDITAQVKLEQNLRQAQKMESIGTLAGGIAHDFNNILAAIMGFGEMALDQAERGDGVTGSVSQIIRSAERARDLVMKILTFSRKVEVDLKPLNLNREIREAVGLLERTIPKMITVATKLEPNVWPVSADATQMQQLLVNLATNAADAMPQGGQLTFETGNLIVGEEYARQYPEVALGPYVLLQVSDTGLGMDDQTRNRLFEPFFTTKGVGEGTGLGLATVYGIVKGHLGHIYCYSQPELGTTFKVLLPAQPALTVGHEDQAAPSLAGGDESILVVDDEQPIRFVCEQMLTAMGYQVQTADSGESALKLYRQAGQRLDLVILDLGMPGMGGLKCMREMLTHDPSVRVIISSGYSADGHVKQCLAAGAAGFVPKPYRRADLLTAVRSVLDEGQHRPA